MRMRITTALGAILLVSACGGGDDGGGSGAVDSPCDLADAALVQEVFGGTVADGVEGVARNCEYLIEGGPVDDVNVYEFGAASSWDGLRSGYEDNRGGTTDVAGIGERAFYPGDVGPLSIIASAGGQNFSVNAYDAFTEAPSGTEELVAELARRIAARLEG